MDYDSQTTKIDFNGTKLTWPKGDTKLQQVNDWVNDLYVVLHEMKERGRKQAVAVQAGGACGIWPLELVKHFQVVYTYEPEPLNYWCLTRNCSAYPSQIAPMQAALGENPGMIDIRLDPSESGNAGAFYTVDGTQVPRIKLDDQTIYDVDLICLDIEGREVEALRGAQALIEKCQPFIMIEEKLLPQMGYDKDVPHAPGEATEWLEKIHGYTVVRKVHRDVILAPPE